ncbi:hypothetical protein E4T44_07626 [Aureobasidium sp. EXF-8845]|nr:hypothetical protein E4T44_07626 [Aureobasidium sp. EXF-8845]KAI4845704.1 hypothetical protein E4T45_07585 [Aureobasidium sp. EXF-8846]
MRNYTTKANDLGPLATNQAVSVFCRYGFDGVFPSLAAHTALRCLCNILLLAEPLRQTFVDGGYPRKALERMKKFDDSFIPARLLFYCTYGTNLDFDNLFCDFELAETIIANISHYAELIKDKARSAEDTATLACNENLKLLHNLTTKVPLHVWRFRSALAPILEIMNKTLVMPRPLQPPMSLLINAMVNLDLQQEEGQTLNPLFPESNETVYLDKLADILDLALRSYTTEDLDRLGSPLVQVLLQISKAAPIGPKSHLCTIFLPSEKDRENVLGKGDSLPSRLLSLFNQVAAPHLSILVPAFYLELSDNDVDAFVGHVGYGLAAGFLHANDMQPGLSARTDVTDPHANLYRTHPITGQRLDNEARVPSPDMTDEEKEREAERLFVLFERLRSTGVINVENPVTVAQQEGRFEEIDWICSA